MSLTVKYVDNTTMQNILSGKQTKLAKVKDGFWADVNVGDVITLIDDNTNRTLDVNIKITNIGHFYNFGEAWFVCGDALFPDNSFVSVNDVNAHFKQTHKAYDDGVIVVTFEKVK